MTTPFCTRDNCTLRLISCITEFPDRQIGKNGRTKNLRHAQINVETSSGNT